MRKQLCSLICILFGASTLLAHDTTEQTNPPSTFQRGKEMQATTPSGPRAADGVNLNLSVDFLWWKATQDGLAYATSGVLSNVGNDLTSRGEQKTPDFGWDPGFKFGFGAALPWDHWDFQLQYTWLYSHNNTSRIRDVNGNISPAVQVGSLTSNTTELTAITSARSSWDLHFNVIDMELGRNYYVSKHITLRPFGGLKWTWQDQDWSVTYNADSVSINGSSRDAQGGVRMNQDQFLWGVGIRTGLNSQWYVTSDWSIFVNTAFSALWNDYSVKRRDKFQPLGTEATVTLNTKSSSYHVHGVAELQLGMMGEWWFYNNDFHFAISAAYEQQVWINYGTFTYLTDREAGDLSLHGLTVKARFDF